MTTSPRRPLAACAALALAGAAAAQDAPPSYPPLDVLLSTGTTIVGQPFAYPGGAAKITAAIVTMVPGQETGWHRHEVPLFAQILEGELTVDYGPDGTKTYKAGDTLVEAFGTSHNGTNTGDGAVRLLAVFAGAEGAANTVADEAPTQPAAAGGETGQ